MSNKRRALSLTNCIGEKHRIYYKPKVAKPWHRARLIPSHKTCDFTQVKKKGTNLNENFQFVSEREGREC